MSATQPTGAQTRAQSEYSVRKHLDALAAGEIDNATFLRIALQRFRVDFEESWEVLSLLDQYHRLGKIKADAFREIRTKIGEWALRPRESAIPMPKAAAAEPARAPTLTQPVREAAPAQREPPAQRETVRETMHREVAQREPPLQRETVREAVHREVAQREPPLQRETVREAVQREVAQREPPIQRETVREAVQREVAQREPPLQRETVREAVQRDMAREPVPREAVHRDPVPRETVREAMQREVAHREPPVQRETVREAIQREAIQREAIHREAVQREPAVEPSFRQPVREAAEREFSARTPGVSRGFAAEDSVREVKVGDVLRRRYRLEAVLGHGSMGTVFEASDPLRLDVPPNGQRLAIKVLYSAVAQRIELLQELRREYQQLQSLSHPNIVRVYEFDRDGPVAFFTMELLSGISLGRLLSARQRRPLPRPLAFAIIRDLLSAIAYAHTRGIVHGDLNPQNMFITTRGELRVVNFGAAQRVGVSPVNAAEEPVTITPATPGFASCQVLEGDRPTSQDDVFAVACLASLLLSGEHPYQDCSSIEARAMRMRPKRPPGLRPRQWLALRSALQFDRKKRPADAQAWMEQLDMREAAPRLPPVAELLEAPAAAPHRFALIALVSTVLIVAAGFWAASQNGWLPELNQRNARHSPPVPADADDTQQASPADDIAAGRAKLVRPAEVPRRSSAAAEPPPAPAPAPVNGAAHSVSPASTLPPNAASPGTAAGTASGTASAPSSTAASPPAASPTRTASSLAASPTRAAAPRAAETAPAAAGASAAAQSAYGRAHVELAADTVDVVPGERQVQVVVRRKGSMRGDTTFNWWTESGTAKPGTDFVAIVPHIEHMEDRQASTTLTVRVSETLRAQPKSFYVVIDEAEGGASLNGRRLTMVTLPSSN